MLAPSHRTRHRSLPQRRRFVAALLAAIGLGSLPVAAQFAAPSPPLLAVATRVLDGDSLIVRSTYGGTMSIRLAAIDAPERKQPWSDASRRHLREQVEGRVLRIEPLKRDVYGRTVARVLLDDGPSAGQDVGLLMVAAGLAWHFTRHAKEQPAEERLAYLQAERLARQRQIGLWRDPRPVPPWEFRSRQRNGRQSTPSTMPQQP
jgi:endonuclease YncB( thermonuclease family)